MKILVYNKIDKCIEILAVLRIHVAFSSKQKYGVMFRLSGGRWIFIPLESKESANEYIRKLYHTEQLDLTKTPIESNSPYGTMDQNDSSAAKDAAVPEEHLTKAAHLHHLPLLSDPFYDAIAKEFLMIFEEADIEYNPELLSEEYIEQVLKNNSDSLSVQQLLQCKEPVKYIYHAMRMVSITPQEKVDTHIVIKTEDVLKYLEEPERVALDNMIGKIMRGRSIDHKCPANHYYICNKDEPYADTVKGVIMGGETVKNSGLN